VLDVRTNCDCLSAGASRKIYAPGSNGTIEARFAIGDRVGRYERIITLVTDESPVPVRLTVQIEVPEVATVAPRSLAWQIGETAAEKTAELTSTPGLDIAFTEAKATSDAFAVSLETVAAGTHYRLHLKPRGTAQPGSAAIRVFGREKSGHDVVVSAYASVR
jgi:hypothetical protein